MFLLSLLQEVDVSVNDVQVSQSSGTYAYRANIESLLSYGPQAKTSKLTAALYYKNTGGNKDRPNHDHANAAEKKLLMQNRSAFTDRSAIVDMNGCIHSDIFFPR